MILGFKTKFPKPLNKPTGFIDKIKLGIKIHTFREDKPDRWNDSRRIQFYEGAYQKGARTNFWQDHDCTGTQAVRIYKLTEHEIHIYINDKLFPASRHATLAKNDGFDSLADFILYFVPNKGDSWSGKIIHWTDFKYT